MIIVYSLEGCPYCEDAIELLKASKAKYKKIVVTQLNKNKHKEVLGIATFPYIILKKSGKNDKDIVIGGFEELERVSAICKVIRKAGVNPEVVGYLCSK